MRSEWKRPEFKEVLQDGVHRIVLELSYDGTRFSGYQAQDNNNGVEDHLEAALFSLLGQEVKVFASGRTDSGVHAISQTCHFDTISNISVERFPMAINAHLSNSYVKVMSAREADGSFHSRFSALAREYHYYMKFNKNHTIFDNNRALAIPFAITKENVAILNRMAEIVKGEKDFAFLSLKEDYGKSTKRDIYISEFYIKGDYLVYRIVGNAFLYHQVRSIVGTILETFRKSENREEAVENFRKITENKKRTNKVFTAPPYALYFYKTIYDEEEWKILSSDIENGCKKV